MNFLNKRRNPDEKADILRVGNRLRYFRNVLHFTAILMKTEMSMEEIEKLEEAARKYSGVDKIRIAFWDGAKWDRQSRIWTNDKVIEFTNWYLKLNRIDPRYELENQTVIDSFLIGDPVEVWDNQYTPKKS